MPTEYQAGFDAGYQDAMMNQLPNWDYWHHSSEDYRQGYRDGYKVGSRVLLRKMKLV